jgi:tetratricopeptide (TPR) repeat protein
LILADQAGAISYFFANPSRAGYNNQNQFVDPKPPNVFRIFVVGESAAKGYPQPPNLASSAFLQAMLTDAWPNRTVEMINLGTTAVASFPVLGMMKEALEFEPDLIIIHTGHNEFFGAYGVNSIGSAGTRVWMLKATRFIRSLALVQAISKALQSDDALQNKTLMEIMMGQTYTSADDSIRTAAARNLGSNIGEMLSLCKRQGVPAIVCTMPSNERDLYPVGEDRVGTLSAPEQEQFEKQFRRGERLLATDPQEAIASLTEATSIHPQHARARFLLATALHATGQTNEALREFVAARDCDSMPWRATSIQQEAIRQAAAQQEAPLCDLESIFRTHSPGGCIGWELMDDHVHPTLRGQALMAEGWVTTLHTMTGPPSISDRQLSAIRPWEDYAQALGDNPYDRYGVDHSMWVLFKVPFMSERNAAGLRRLEQRTAEFAATLSPEHKEVARQWQSARPHAGGKRPITGMMARQLMREKRYEEALELFEIAQNSVPEYTSWHMEYVYFALVCKDKLVGSLTEDERQAALEEIEQGQFLLRRGFSESGLTERYIGRLHQLRGEWTEAIPFLNASRQKLGGFDLVAADQALFMSLTKTDRRDEARQLAEHGVANSGQYARFYQQMLGLLEAAPEVAPAEPRNGSPGSPPPSDL